jgi:predicted neuraminidase
VETLPNRFCAVWKGGPGDGKSNIDIKMNVGIWLSLYENGQWSEAMQIVKSENSVCWNPVLCKFSEKEILLFFRIGKDPRNAVAFLKRSCDGGKTWSDQEILPAGILGPTKCKPIITSDGTLVCPSSFQAGNPEDAYKATALWIDISKDKGKHWQKIGPLEIPNSKFGAIEPALFYDSQGRLKLFCRDRSYKMGEKGFICTATSIDNGYSWSQLEPTLLPNPDSAIDIVDLGKGKIVLLYNHSHTCRYPLHLAISQDGGDSWSAPYVIDESGEFPSGILSTDGKLHVTYAVTHSKSDQRRIRHCVIDLSYLLAN